jgi:hypothetical protein
MEVHINHNGNIIWTENAIAVMDGAVNGIIMQVCATQRGVFTDLEVVRLAVSQVADPID